MADYVLWPSVPPSEVDWTLNDYTGKQISPLSGAIRTVSRGQRWEAHFRFDNLTVADRAAMMSLAAALRGAANRVWLSDPAYRQQGTFPGGELLTNGDFRNGTTGWTAAGTAALAANNRVLRLTATGTTTPGCYQSVSLTNAQAYILRACIVDGLSTAGLTLGTQLNDTGHAYNNQSTSRGLISAVALAQNTGAANQYPITINPAGLTTGSWALVTYASLQRCALVQNPGSAWYSTGINIDALPTSTVGLLRAGDRIEINGELKTLTADLNSDSSGVAYCMFEPALRAVAPDNCAVVIGQPMGKFLLAADASYSTIAPGIISSFDLQFIEASS